MHENNTTRVHIHTYIYTCTNVHSPELKTYTYMYLWFLRWLDIFKEVIEVDKSVCKHLESLAGLGVVHKHYRDVVDVPQVSQLRGEVDVPRDKDHCRGSGIGVGKTTKALTKLVISSILSNGTDMY